MKTSRNLFLLIVILLFTQCGKKGIVKTKPSSEHSTVFVKPVQIPVANQDKTDQTKKPGALAKPVPSARQDPAIDKNLLFDKPVHYPEEVHLKNVRQLTYGGENAEAYFSTDDKQLVLQKTQPSAGYECDQIFYADLVDNNAPLDMKLVSTGDGRTTCSFFMPGNEEIIFASTHKADKACPPTPDREKIKKYVWPIYDTFEIYLADKSGNITKQYTDNNFYDAEATVSPDGNLVVFTSK